MEELFINLFGKPRGIIISQLISACRFTIYLSLIAFLGGGGVIGSLIVLMRIVPNNIFKLYKFYIYMVISVCSTFNAFIFNRFGSSKVVGF